MNFIISSSVLLKNLQTVGGVLNTSNTMPILDNFLFDVSDGKMVISASDLETTMTVAVEAQTKENGKIAIPAKLLLETLKTFPEQPLNFNVNLDTYNIEISSDFGKYKLCGFDAEEFPKSPAMDNANKASITAEILGKAISKTIFATGNDELRPVMSGILFQFSPEGLTFVATDAHKLVRYIRKDSTTEKASDVVLPKKPLGLLKAILGTTNDEVKIEFNDSHAFFSFDSVTLICRLIDGKFPNYEAVIPAENPNLLNIGRIDLLNSIKRVSIFSNKTTHQVRFKLAGSELSLSAEDLDFNNEANEKLACSYEGEDMEIGFNSRFVAEMLNNIETDDIQVKMSAPNRAGIIVPKMDDDSKEDLLMLVMPVMLNN
ncbi:MAG: DNA polymerase-3 subunit beta [Luteibaculaceae bacterium]|jgi:DNA polymerase-3 subunit beta